MPLAPGTWLGQYEILEHIGSGGMGEVYRANDNKLQREVALKVLPEHFARDPERIARFRREAQLLAQLNHPNIAILYNFEETGETRFLVMELVLGETLRERIKRGPLPLEEALDICSQITEALEHAHEKPIIHRDLKPANVKVTPQGQVKVLDFGLAKAFGADRSAIDPHDAPTGSLAGTLKGTILGTPAYMPPEQASGRTVDKRADIWALGCVLYELLTGKQAFTGDTVTEIIASVLKSEPDWSALPADTGPNVRVLLRRCLRKDLPGRFRDAVDVRIQIEEAQAAPPAPTVTVVKAAPPAPLWRRALPWALAAVMAVVASLAVSSVWRGSVHQSRPPLRFTVALPPGDSLSVEAGPAVALSPDGSRVAYVAAHGETNQLYLRGTDEFQGRPIPGTEAASQPFFSPDGQWVGFFTVLDGKLKKVAVTGGALLTLCDAFGAWGGSWAPDNTIFFSSRWSGESLMQVSAAGGEPRVVRSPDAKKGENGYRWPEVLPGGKAILLTVGTAASFDDARIAVLPLATGQLRTLVEGGSNPHYVSGQIIYARAGGLLAVPFDVERFAATGPPVPALEGVITGAANGEAQFTTSASGSLAYIPGRGVPSERTLTWVDRNGAAQPISETRRAYEDLALSPDGRRVAVTIEGVPWNVWVHEIGRGNLTKLTFEGANTDPEWTPDGKRIVFTSFRNRQYGLFWKPADGSGPEERLTTSPNFPHADSFTPDGKTLLFDELHPESKWDLWALSLEGERKAKPFLRTPFSEEGPALSPDGRWVAYFSDESGREEVYVQPFPGPGGKVQISTEGGRVALWAKNGRELFYRKGDKMMAVSIETQPEFRAGTPRVLFTGRYKEAGHDFDVTADGQRLLLIKASEQEQEATQINVVLNWFEELRRRVPAAR